MVPRRVRAGAWLPGMLVIAALSSISCGASGAGSADAVRTVTVRENPDTTSRLSTALRDSKRGSVEHTLFSLYFFARWGNYASIPRLYEERVREVIDSRRIAAVYSQNRARFLAVDVPRVVDKFDEENGTLLAVELTPEEGEKISESYLMRRRGGKWVIAHDTFFERAYSEYVRAEVDGPGAKPTRSGRIAGLRAAERFRNLTVQK